MVDSSFHPLAVRAFDCEDRRGRVLRQERSEHPRVGAERGAQRLAVAVYVVAALRRGYPLPQRRDADVVHRQEAATEQVSVVVFVDGVDVERVADDSQVQWEPAVDGCVWFPLHVNARVAVADAGDEPLQAARERALALAVLGDVAHEFFEAPVEVDAAAVAGVRVRVGVFERRSEFAGVRHERRLLVLLRGFRGVLGTVGHRET